jgi:hypothetical protein
MRDNDCAILVKLRIGPLCESLPPPDPAVPEVPAGRRGTTAHQGLARFLAAQIDEFHAIFPLNAYLLQPLKGRPVLTEEY